MKEEKEDMIEEIVREIPDLSRREREIIYYLLTMTGVLHFLVFPEARNFPIFGIVSEGTREIPENDLIAYDYQQDSYIIFPYNSRKKLKSMQRFSFFKIWDEKVIRDLSEMFESIKQRDVKGAIRRLSIAKKQQIPKFTWEETVVGAAAHEVRHRVQKFLPVRLLSFQEIIQLNSLRIKLLARLIDEIIIQPNSLTGEEATREMDAALIGHLAVMEWNRGKTSEEISPLIKMNLEEISGFLGNDGLSL